MFLSLCYVVLRRVLQLAVLRCRSDDFKDLEIVVLRHELAILRHASRRRLTIPDHKELAKGTLRSLIREAGITIDQFIQLLT